MNIDEEMLCVAEASDRIGDVIFERTNGKYDFRGDLKKDVMNFPKKTEKYLKNSNIMSDNENLVCNKFTEKIDDVVVQELGAIKRLKENTIDIEGRV